MPILDLFRLEGKTALVTGGARGIGKTCALALAEAGANVCVADLAHEDAVVTAREIEALGRKSLAIPCDVTRSAEVDTMISKVVEVFGSLDIAFNNAGICINTPAEEMTDDEWSRVMEVNLNAVFYCARAEGRQMLGQKNGGRIINTASMSAQIVNRPQPQSGYNASKAGVVQLTKSLAAEWAGRGINVNSISPGYTGTEMTLRLKELHPLWEKDTPMGRLARPDEICGAVVFLASDAASFVTGHDLAIDGGFTCW